MNNNETMLPRNNINNDRLHKIRPVISNLILQFKKLPYAERLSLDEQMCATKAKNYLKQFMPAKPHKWGYKLFLITDTNGFTYNFEIYTGQENDHTKRLDTETNLGSCANTVVRLVRDVPRHLNHKIYHDNYYTTTLLAVTLAKQGIQTVETVRRDRVPNLKLPTLTQMKNQPRGTSVEYVANIDETDVSTVVWKDNKIVSLLSTFCNINPTEIVTRYDKKNKSVLNIFCPSIVKEYNKHMGGVDLMDSHIGRYKIKIKSRK